MEECTHCNGFGSSFQDPPEQYTCSQCGGTGLRKDQTGDKLTSDKGVGTQ